MRRAPVWATLLITALATSAHARPWRRIEPGTSTRADVIRTFSEPTRSRTANGREVLAYMGLQAAPGTVQVQFQIDSSSGLVARIDVFPAVTITREEIEASYGPSCKDPGLGAQPCFVEKISSNQQLRLGYRALQLTVFFRADRTVSSLTFLAPGSTSHLAAGLDGGITTHAERTPVDVARAPGDGGPPADGGPADPPQPRAPGYRTGLAFQGFPMLNFSSDEGFGYGGRVQLVDRGDNDQPYRFRVMLQFFQTTRDVAYHRLYFDAPNLFGTRWRVDLDLAWYRDKFSPYYGLGNDSAHVRDFETCADRSALAIDPNTCAGNEDFRGLRYYTYSKDTLPRIKLNVRRSLAGPLKVFVGYRFFLTTITPTYSANDLGQAGPSKLLEDGRAGLLHGFPAGYDFDRAERFSRRTGELTAGVIVDTRDAETSPGSGMFHELSGRLGSFYLGGEFETWGANLTARFYEAVPFYNRVVGAVRIIFDVMGGQVPFWMLSGSGGMDGPEGIGGAYSARGVLKNRRQGKVKLLLNPEVRWTFLTLSGRGQTFDFGVVVAADLGRVWRDLPSLVSGGDRGGFALGSTVGLRIAWNQTFLLRIDYGIIAEKGSGFYLVFDQMF